MKTKAFALTTSLLACSALFAGENPHRVNLGVDGFVDHAEKKETQDDTEVKTSADALLGGVHVGYDYVAADSFYAGTEGLFAAGRNQNVRLKVNGEKVESGSKETPILANVEQRFGYTIGTSAGSTVTPFIGAGWFYSKPYDLSNTQLTSDWFYGAAGLRINGQVTQCFDMGLNLLGMYSFAGREKTSADGVVVENKRGTMANSWGYKAELPLTWHIDSARTWDIQVVPYYEKLNVKNDNWLAGARLLVGYNF
jgi:hypothetical protein